MPDSLISAFRFEANESVLDDLTNRLRNVVWPDEVEATAWRYGPPVEYMKGFVEHWVERYDWRAQERRLNGFPQFSTSIDGHRIHFIHQPGSGPAPIPIVLTHGWPGSIVELLRIMPLLTDPEAHGGDPADAFTVVAPSIPGYGFSGRPKKPGMGVFAIADLWPQLMDRLGYQRFGLQGGDWGFWISAATALRHPERVLGLHLNYVSGRFRPAIDEAEQPLSREEHEYLARASAWSEAEGAYIAVQGTKPLTLGYALSDSPVGLAAWYVDKFRSWTDCAAEPDETLSRDDMITDVMLYWLTGTAHSAMRLYAEAREHPFHLSLGQRVTPPCGIVNFPRELPMPPKRWVDRAFNVVHWTNAQHGGHFAAWEQPQLLAEDIRAFFRPLRSRA